MRTTWRPYVAVAVVAALGLSGCWRDDPAEVGSAPLHPGEHEGDRPR